MDLSVNAARIKMRSPDNVSLSGPLQVTAVAQMKWMVDLNTGLKFPHPSTYCSRRPIQLECVKSGNEDASHQCVCRHPGHTKAKTVRGDVTLWIRGSDANLGVLLKRHWYLTVTAHQSSNVVISAHMCLISRQLIVLQCPSLIKIYWGSFKQCSLFYLAFYLNMNTIKVFTMTCLTRGKLYIYIYIYI